MNTVFVVLILAAFGSAAWAEATGQAGAMEALSAATLKAAEGALPLASASDRSDTLIEEQNRELVAARRVRNDRPQNR